MNFALLLACLPAAVLARDGPRALGRVPAMGWNTWCTQNTCGTDWCSSAEVLDVATEIKANGMLDAGYDHINLDDCWGVRNNETGEIEGDPERFPEGMPAFISKVHDLGFKFGLYTDIGTMGCHHPFVGSWPDYQRDANTFAAWHVDYVKFDGCDQPKAFDAETLTCNMSQALNNTGHDMWLNFHCWHNSGCAKCGNSYRIFDDHHDNWASTSGVMDFLANKRQDWWGPDPDRGWPDADFIYTGGQGCGKHSEPGVRCPGQSEDEYISEYSVWAISQGQIVLATDPRNMTSFMKKYLLNKEVIAVFQDVSGFQDIKMIPVAAGKEESGAPLAESKCSVTLTKKYSESSCDFGKSFGCTEDDHMWTSSGCRGDFTCNGIETKCDVMGSGKHVCECAAPPAHVWVRPLKGGGAAVVLHNPNEQAAAITVKFSDVPKRSWGDGTLLKVRDLWEGKDVGTSTGQYTAESVPKHGSVFVTLTPA